MKARLALAEIMGEEFDPRGEKLKKRDGRPRIAALDAMMFDIAMASRVILILRKRKVSVRQAFKLAERHFPKPGKDTTYSHKNIERAFYAGRSKYGGESLMALLWPFPDHELEGFAKSPEQIVAFLADKDILGGRAPALPLTARAGGRSKRS